MGDMFETIGYWKSGREKAIIKTLVTLKTLA